MFAPPPALDQAPVTAGIEGDPHLVPENPTMTPATMLKHYNQVPEASHEGERQADGGRAPHTLIDGGVGRGEGVDARDLRPPKKAKKEKAGNAKPKLGKAKKNDPKGSYELERQWRACKTSTDRRTYAGKILRPDGAVANALFGDRSTGTVEADVLCGLVVARLSAATEQRGISKTLEALELMVGAARFGLSAMMLSTTQQARIGSCLDEMEVRVADEVTKFDEAEKHRGRIAALKAAFHCG